MWYLLINKMIKRKNEMYLFFIENDLTSPNQSKRKNEMYLFFIENDLTSPNQSGFKQRDSLLISFCH